MMLAINASLNVFLDKMFKCHAMKLSFCNFSLNFDLRVVILGAFLAIQHLLLSRKFLFVSNHCSLHFMLSFLHLTVLVDTLRSHNINRKMFY